MRSTFQTTIPRTHLLMNGDAYHILHIWTDLRTHKHGKHNTKQHNTSTETITQLTKYQLQKH